MILSRLNPPAALVAGLLLAAPAPAFDLNDLPSSARNKLGLPGGHPDADDDEMSPFAPGLRTEAIPFIGDFPIVDSLYVVGPGDILQVFYENTALEKQVNPEGNILLARLGALKVGGKTLKEAKKVVLERLQGVYKKSECFVNLARPKTMKVFVTGAANVPGTFEVSGNTRLSDLFNLAQGFAPTARRDAIRITTRDGATSAADLRRFYMDGDLEHNPYLPQGGFVRMDYLDYDKPWLTIRRDTLQLPIQIEPGESLADLILKFHAFRTPPAFSTLILKEADGKIRSVSQAESRNLVPAPGTQVEIQPQFRDIYVGGAVARPGFQPYRPNRSVQHYISEAGILTSSRLADKVVVSRSDGRREKVDLKSGMLQPGDMVYVDQNSEQRFIIYTPILLSLASFSIAIITLFR